MSWGGSGWTNPSFSNIKSSFYSKIPGKMSAFTKCISLVGGRREADLVSGGQTVAEGAGVAVQSGVGVSPDGVVSEQGLSYRARHLEHQTCYIWYTIIYTYI